MHRMTLRSLSRPSSRSIPPTRHLLLSRKSSSQTKPVSPHVGFYKDFGRPIAKVFLGAMFTYQVIYSGWLYLEAKEIRIEKEAEITALENTLRRELSTTTTTTTRQKTSI